MLLRLLALAVAFSGAPPVDAPPDPLSAARTRGHVLARQLCAACHAVEADGTSPDRRAPPFRALSGQFVQLTLARRLAEIAETGHYAMPAINVHSDEVADIVAYMNSLEGR
jgi:mono/diheme cytochrome c family protein